MMKKKLTLFMMGLLPLGILFSQEKEQNDTIITKEEVVIQGNRISIPFSQITRDVDVLTNEEIKKLPVTSINELLAYVGGVDIRQRGPFGTQADISIDGGSSEQTLVLLNGIKLIDDQTAHNMMNIPVPLEAIERIEILKGAAARVYGVNSLTGAINIVTKKSERSSVTAHLYAGSSFTEKEEGDGSGIYGGGGIQVTGNFSTQKQQHLLSIGQDLYNGQRYNSAQNNTRFFYNGEYQFDEKNQISLLAGHQHNRFGANGFYAAPGDTEAEEIVETTIVGISSVHKIGNFTLSPRISNRYNEDDYRYFKHDLNTARSLHYANALMAEINGNWKTKIGTFGLGWESRFQNITSSSIGKHQRNNHGISGEYKGVFWRKLIANVGIYVNYNTNFGWQTYPGIDMAYLFNENWKIFASAGSGQRIPSFTDLYLNQLPGNVGNPDIQPENAWQYEGNIQYHKKNLRIQTGYFYRNISDFIDWIRPDENHPYSPINFGNNKVHGIYAKINQRFQFKNHHELGYQISYNYLQPSYHTDDENESKYILTSLKHQLIAGLHYRYKNISIQLNNRWIERELNTPYDVMDVRINYQVNSFTVYADVSNILNAKYKEAGAVPMPPRWFQVGVRYGIDF